MATTPEAWEIYVYPFGEGQRAIVGFDVNAAEETTHIGGAHGRRVVIYCDLQQVRTNGLPEAPELERIGRIEERLLNTLKEQSIDCRLVGRLTYGGRRELVFQMDDPTPFDATVETWRSAEAADTKVIDGQGWQYFEDGVRPRDEHWVQIYDRRVIDELLKAGTEPRRTHQLEFTFRGLPPLLLTMARVLETNGFVVVRYKPDVLLVKEPSRLELDRIWAISSEFKRVADAHGVTYEGWGTSIVPPAQPPVKDELLSYDQDGTPRVLLCPHCCTQLGTGATRCGSCEADVTGEALVDLSIDDHAAESRVSCASCGQMVLSRAYVCPHCRQSPRESAD